MKKDVNNTSHSIHQRLLNKARETNQPFNALLQHYAIERFLYRISKSEYSEKLLLKGALLLRVWDVPIVRPTMDIDMLGQFESTEDTVKEVIKDCMNEKVEDDGFQFYPESISTEVITENAEYQGIRARFRVSLGKANVTLQVDIGIGDDVVPAPLWIDYPSILNQDMPHLLAYTPESAIAEKFQAMVELELANSRMKDFYDIWLLANNLSFDGEILSKAIKATFTKRNTAIPSELPFCLSDQFYDNEMKQTQWKAFINKSRLENMGSLEDVVRIIESFLMPPAKAIANKKVFDQKWKSKGPWKR